MSDIDMRVDQAAVDELARDLVEAAFQAQVATIKFVSRKLEQELEGLTKAAVRGKAWRAWTSAAYPLPSESPKDLSARGYVYPKGGSRTAGMMKYFTLPGTNRAKEGRYLAIPTQAAMNTSQGRHISPQEWQRRNGIELQVITVGNRKLMVADGSQINGAFVPGGRDRMRARQRGGQNVKASAVVVFVLIETQAHANRISVYPSIVRARDSIEPEFRKRLDRAVSRAAA